MENTEHNTNKVALAAKVDPAVFGVVTSLAAQEDRTVSNMVERLLKASPQVQELLAAHRSQEAVAA